PMVFPLHLVRLVRRLRLLVKGTTARIARIVRTLFVRTQRLQGQPRDRVLCGLHGDDFPTPALAPLAFVARLYAVVATDDPVVLGQGYRTLLRRALDTCLDLDVILVGVCCLLF